MVKRFTEGDLIGLKPDEACFVIEYLKDFDARRSAEASGHPADSGFKMRDRANINAAVQHVLIRRLEASDIDAEWLLMEAVDNHIIARQKGKLNASNTALNLIAKHTLVDALASDKLNMNIHGDKDIMERLQRGRNRAKERAEPQPKCDELIIIPNDDEVSFF